MSMTWEALPNQVFELKRSDITVRVTWLKTHNLALLATYRYGKLHAHKQCESLFSAFDTGEKYMLYYY